MNTRPLLPLAVFLASCAHSPEAAAPAAPVDLDFEISFRARSGAELPVPIVHLTLEGRPASLLLDSGSTHHALTASAASRFALEPLSPPSSGTVHGGARVSVHALGSLDASIGARDLVLDEVVRIDAPDAFDALGIDGVLSPQRLAADARLTLDFPARRATLSPSPGDPDPSARTRPHVHVSFDGHDAVLALVDTGGSRSEYAGFGVDPTGHSDSGIAIDGSRPTSRALEGRRVDLGGARFDDVTVLAVDASKAYAHEDVRALVGMDLLRHCVVSLTRSHADVTCDYEGSSTER